MRIVEKGQPLQRPHWKEGEEYDKLLKLLEERGYTSYRIRKEKVLGQATLTAIKNGTGGLDHRSIARLCEVLHCQPGDLMEYQEAPQQPATDPTE